ncbi:hypothetical protein D0A35_03425 [Xanthomonas campestris]|nr:hypothetical protein D0A35_03425 [Xanthomonas campestris]
MHAALKRHNGLAAVVISGPQRDLLRYNRSCSQGSKATQKCRPRRCAIIRQVEVFSQPASAGAA